MPKIDPTNRPTKWKAKCHSCGDYVPAGTGNLARIYYEYGDKIGKLKQHHGRNGWVVYCDCCNELIFLDGGTITAPQEVT